MLKAKKLTRGDKRVFNKENMRREKRCRFRLLFRLYGFTCVSGGQETACTGSEYNIQYKHDQRVSKE
eukprot:1491439-Pyramimonas_sp.AAC.2